MLEKTILWAIFYPDLEDLEELFQFKPPAQSPPETALQKNDYRYDRQDTTQTGRLFEDIIRNFLQGLPYKGARKRRMSALVFDFQFIYNQVGELYNPVWRFIIWSWWLYNPRRVFGNGLANLVYLSLAY